MIRDRCCSHLPTILAMSLPVVTTYHFRLLLVDFSSAGRIVETIVVQVKVYYSLAGEPA